MELRDGVKVLRDQHRELALCSAERCLLLTQAGLTHAAELARLEENLHVGIVRALEHLLRDSS